MSHLIKLIGSLDYVMCLTVSKFHEFLNIRSMSNNDKNTSFFIYFLDSCLAKFHEKPDVSNEVNDACSSFIKRT